MRCGLVGLGIAIVVGTLGCTGQAKPKGTATNNMQPAAVAATTPAPQAIVVPANAPPDQVVSVFLSALRSGDSATTESLLTTKAREELAKHSLSVDPISAPDSTYQVHPADILKDNPNGAHVSSQWTEKFDEGEEKYEIIWALRRQPEGWRLAGMALQLVPDKLPEFLNFEDPPDMLRKKEEAMAALMGPAAQTAEQPQNLTLPAQPVIER